MTAFTRNMRDPIKRPYDKQERRVVDYLRKIAPQIGAGDDPIGFLIASHMELSRRVQWATEFLQGGNPNRAKSAWGILQGLNIDRATKADGRGKTACGVCFKDAELCACLRPQPKTKKVSKR